MTEVTEPVEREEGRTILEVLDLMVRIGGRLLMRDLGFEVQENTIFGITGRSGVGKSTLALVLAGLADDFPDIDAQATKHDLEASYVGRVGYLAQRPLIFDMSIRDNVALPALSRGVNRKADLDEIVERSLRTAGLWPDVKDRLDEKHVSPGQLQLLAFARVLASDAKLLILDEPLSHLDPLKVALFEDSLQEIKNELTIVLISHDLQGLARVTDYTAYFDSERHPDGVHDVGVLVEIDRTETIFSNPGDQRTEYYLTGRPLR